MRQQAPGKVVETSRKVKGFFRIVGSSPDGDSVRFHPQDPAVWESAGIAVRANAAGGAQLRLDAIDALETHYTPTHAHSPGHEPAGLGEGAAAALLDFLAFTDVVRGDRGIVTSASPDQRAGYILTRFADKYGRAVAMAFSGGRPGRAGDGSSVFFAVEEMHRSVNYQLLKGGWVYPTFYSKLYFDLRADLVATAVAAREAKQGVWAQDATLDGFRLKSRTQLTDELVILPMLFRRLAEYLMLDETGKGQPGRFPRVPRCAPRPDLHRAGRPGHLPRHPGGTCGTEPQLSLPPEQIVFHEG